ncbi:hypothetical protein BGX27_007118 [Mortierella sp. AM989]|nr:hypothetical protein BGX27_007118 [Mortierella sp. AM989]
MSVDNSTKLTWCQNQVGFCTNVCQELTKGAETVDNRCDILILQYSCLCQGGVVPNITEYTYTIPYFMCVADVQQCIKSCKLSDNGCYTTCNQRICAAEFPKKYNQTLATTTAATPTSTSGPQITDLPPGIFGNAGNTYRGVQSWTAFGGSSVLGLVVFLTVGVMFGSIPFIAASLMTTSLSPTLNCTEFVAAEGRYELLQDIFLDQVLPHPVITTHVSSVSVKYKDYLSAGGSNSKSHGKQTSADSALSVPNLDRLEERLKDINLKDERSAGDEDEGSTNHPPGSSGALPRNFHGNLIDHNDEYSNGYKSPRSEMSPALPQVTAPGPPPLKDSTSSNRLFDPYDQFGPPPLMPPQTQQQHSSRSLSRANSYYSSGQDDSNNASLHSSSAPGSSTGFSSFFGGKKKKPKNNIAKTNSTFVAKITTHENLAKILANRVGEDVYLFWNTGRTFTWSDLGQKPNEPLSHILFSKAFPTSHDVNILTRSCDSLDVIIGFSSGDIIWFDPLCNKYYRLNKQAIIKDSAVTMIKWMPGSESQFMAAFHDGSILIMDKERDDSTFTAPSHSDDNIFHVTRPKHGKHNPISHWQVAKKPITAFAFSPDLQHVAIVSMDGCLRVIDFRSEKLLDTFSAYFGALTCVCWSPDGKYILSGGQDDLVTIWSFKDQRIVARCQGHQSYVTGVAFDPWRCDERNYRFGSVGEDAKLILWDFSVGALHKPKAHQHNHNRQSAPTIAEEPAHEHTFSADGDASSVASSARNSGVHDIHISAHNAVSSQLHPPLQGEGSSVGSNTSSNSSVYSSILASENGRSRAFSTSATTTTATGLGAGDSIDAGSSSSVYKKSSFARTLPHLHLHKSNHHHGSNGDGKFDSHHNSEYSQDGHGLPPLFRHSNGTLSNQSVQVVRPPEPRSHVAMLQPLMVKGVHQEPLASITFKDDAILTSDRRGHIKVWKRPPAFSPHP